MNKSSEFDIDPKFRNKYRILSARLVGYDYSQNGAYFVTICTKNQEHYFGEIVDREMRLSDIGKIAKNEWTITPKLRLDMNLKLGEFVVMPNHFHGIIIIGENKHNIQHDANRRDAMHCVSTTKTNKSNGQQQSYKNQFGPQSKNLASIIRGFKISVTKNARTTNPGFAWQPRFHDHIIRNEPEYQRIAEYIYSNPINWENDDYF